jgi:DNA gyrase/topoisomerase IV subunit B
MSKDLYTDASIESLDAREHVRLRSGMYIGSNANPNQLLLEVFSNALDEHNIGHGDVIKVNIANDDSVTVQDYGQGFPVGVKRDDGKTVFEASFCVINTSGKFSDDGVYGGSALGLNGIGLKLATFLSLNLTAETHRDGHFEKLYFVDGYLKASETGSTSELNGTIIKFIPDPQFFDSPATDIKFFKSFFKDISCLCPNLTIELNGEKIKSEAGIEDFILSKIKNKVELIQNRFTFQNKNFAIGLTFTGESNANMTAYVNYGYTESGPHITGIKSSITRIFNNYARENGLLKEKEKNLDGSSIQEGMYLVCNIISTGVSYDAQTKGKIVKVDTSFLDTFNQELEVWLDNNPDDANIIIEKALIARKASEAAKKAREAVKTKAAKRDNVFKLPTTLTDCWTKNRKKAELFVTEGKSAASGLVAGRDSETQAVYGVRGKMLSVLKTKPENIIKNQEINNLIQALGLDYNPKSCKCIYDVNKLRYGKIIAAADADPDGKLIENLLFNILWYICPELIINGHVYSAVPPLYRITTKNNEYIFLAGDNELEEYKKTNAQKTFLISRNKGLGEQDSDELSECLLGPETRNLYQLTVSDIGKTNKMFTDLYGKNVEPRVKFLEEHLEEANID